MRADLPTPPLDRCRQGPPSLSFYPIDSSSLAAVLHFRNSSRLFSQMPGHFGCQQEVTRLGVGGILEFLLKKKSMAGMPAISALHQLWAVEVVSMWKEKFTAFLHNDGQLEKREGEGETFKRSKKKTHI